MTTTAMTETAPEEKTEREAHRRYRLLNKLWPDKLPLMTDKQVRLAARVLYKKLTGMPFRGKLTIKHRGRSWMNKHRIVGNSYQGWHDVIHDWSHDIHQSLYPNEKQHGPHQSYIERMMVEEVLAQGWLNQIEPIEAVPVVIEEAPSTKTEIAKAEIVVVKPVKDIQRERHEKVLKSLKRWEAKLRRAETAIKKLKRQAKYYERQA